MNGAQLRADSIRAGTVTAALQSGGPNTFNTLERRFLSTRDPGVDLGRLYAQRAAWQFFRGDVADAHRTASLALDATDTVDPSGIRTAILALLAETSALAGDHASATAWADQIEQAPPRAAGIIAGTVQAHRAATQLLLRTPHAGEALRRAAAQFHQEGQFGFAAETLYSGVRFGRRRAAADLCALADHLEGDLHRMRIEQARALLDADPIALYAVAERLQVAGLTLHAAEVAAAVLRTEEIPDSLRDRASRRIAGYLSEQPPSALIGHPLLRTPLTTSTVSRLTPREREVSALIEMGLTNAEIADRLKLSLVTIEGHITRIYRKTGASRRAPARRRLH
jgi:DNA-binding CsgD family transcriptional regulator